MAKMATIAAKNLFRVACGKSSSDCFPAACGLGFFVGAAFVSAKIKITLETLQELNTI